jgi:hypothetical protein
MPENESRSMAKLPAQFEHLAALIDGCYGRETLLSSNGIQSFAPALRFSEMFAASSEELQEHRKVYARAIKLYIWPDLAEATIMGRLVKEARSREELTGNSWEGEFTEYARRYTKMELLERKRLADLKRPYLDEQTRLHDLEIRRFSTDKSQLAELDHRKHAEFCKSLLETSRPKTGMAFDRALSDRSSLVFSKAIDAHWRLSIRIHRGKVNQPFDTEPFILGDRDTGERIYPGVTLDMDIVVTPEDPAIDRIPSFRFMSVFPIAELGFQESCGSFHSIRELEANLNIRLEMLRLFEPELRAAVS